MKLYHKKLFTFHLDLSSGTCRGSFKLTGKKSGSPLQAHAGEVMQTEYIQSTYETLTISTLAVGAFPER
jgi:hypothetical protein